MRIGELARRAGTTPRALRFYESQGLLEAQRTANGYREYHDEDVRLVNEILALQTGTSRTDWRLPTSWCGATTTCSKRA